MYKFTNTNLRNENIATKCAFLIIKTFLSSLFMPEFVSTPPLKTLGGSNNTENIFFRYHKRAFVFHLNLIFIINARICQQVDQTW